MPSLILYIGLFMIVALLLNRYNNLNKKVVLFKISVNKNISTGELSFVFRSLWCRS